ncbi:uncharacterized protein EDB91DRAFT_1250006 [Suillus paluster]|uniref:uncharacterized protein n=1 Tax=Suillus paluster TaxID=48578 RepID=UPI001B86987E|nr:uncharacterized protein EDB91DRAFT_1250006 [Suillus paluster]KAG1736393.1 hypothetical protein EDB91DRAFT_1250006 [Suillus paluster]
MVATQALRSVSPVRVVSYAKTESLLAPVISKSKAIDDSLENFILPCEKKCRFPAARSKCKADEEIPHGSLPPSPKKHSLSCSYAIADLTTADLPHKIPQGHSKRKEYGDTPDGSFPPSYKRRTLSRSYAIADLTTADLPHKIPQEHSKRKAYGDMLDGSFPPSFKRHTLSRSYVIADLTAHSATEERSVDPVLFLHSLKGVQSKPMSSIMCFDAPPGVDLASLFQLIKDLDCSSFNPSAVSSLRRLSVDLPMFFSPCVASLTLATLQDSPLTDLSLTYTGLSSIQWAALLRNVHLPLLQMLTVDIECPPNVLAEFLIRHQNVGQLWIHLGSTLSPKLPNHALQKVSRQTLQHIPNSHLLHLNVLGGPPCYLVSLLAIIHSAPCIRNLSLQFGENLTSNHLSAVLDVTQHFTSIQALQLSFFDASHTASHFNVPYDGRTVPSKHLTISVCGPYPDALLFRCHPWLDAFHELESVELQAKCTSSFEKLAELFSRTDNPFQLKISSDW